MIDEKLTAEQWQAIAEKLAEKLAIACSQFSYCDTGYGCPIPCPKHKIEKRYDGYTGQEFITQAKKELGYE